MAIEYLNFLILALVCALNFAQGQRTPPPRAPKSEKYNLHRLPFDVRPVWYLVGVWENTSPQSVPEGALPYSDVLDFGIGVLPMFGARSLNYTGHIFDRAGNVAFDEYGYLIVKNRTRFERDRKTAFLTVTDRGYTTLEEGVVEFGRMSYGMRHFAQRSFNTNGRIRLQRFQRTFAFRQDVLTQTLQYEIRGRSVGFTVRYRKTGGWRCITGCRSMERLGLVGQCNLC